MTCRGYYFDWVTGLYYLQSRYYCPALRRFISADALLDTGVGILGTNMYIYCNNDPVNLVDPDGFSPFDARGFALSIGMPENIFSIIAPVISGLPPIWQSGVLAGLQAILNETSPDEWEGIARNARGNVVDLRQKLSQAVQASDGALTANTIGIYLFGGTRIVLGHGTIDSLESRQTALNWLGGASSTVGLALLFAPEPLFSTAAGTALKVVGSTLTVTGAGAFAERHLTGWRRAFVRTNSAFDGLQHLGLPTSVSSMASFLSR